MFIQSNSFRQWLLDYLNWNQIRDLAEHGVSNGFPGLSSLAQCTHLYEQFEDEMWEMLEFLSEINNYDDVITFLNTVSMIDKIITPAKSQAPGPPQSARIARKSAIPTCPSPSPQSQGHDGPKTT